jgi:hypothetical protein
LRRRQTDARLFQHGFVHVIDELLELPGAYVARVYGSRNFTQDWISQFCDRENSHYLRLAMASE